MVRPKAALLIDGAHVQLATRTLGFAIDFKRLLHHFSMRVTISRAMFFLAVTDGFDRTMSRSLVNWLECNGYTVIARPSRKLRERGQAPACAIGVDLSVSAMTISGQVDEIILFAGEGGFRALARSIQRRGVRVTVVSTVIGGVLVSDELRRQADQFIELADIKDEIALRNCHRDGPTSSQI